MNKGKKNTHKVLVFGALNIDYVYQMEQFVQAKETVSSLGRQSFCGGKGLNQAIAISKSGVEVWQAGAVGDNDSAMLYRSLEEAGVHTELIMKKEGTSGHAIIQNIPDGENCIILYGGANQEITRKDVDDVLSHFETGDLIVLQNEISQLSYIMETAHERGMTIVLNPSPMNEVIFTLPLDYADYLIVNEVEGKALCAGDTRESCTGEELLDSLMKKLPDVKIILTLGAEGSMYGYHKERCYQRAINVHAIDTTAAGDTYTGFFIGSLLQGQDVATALETASKASAIAVSRRGASSSIPSIEEVRNWEKF